MRLRAEQHASCALAHDEDAVVEGIIRDENAPPGRVKSSGGFLICGGAASGCAGAADDLDAIGVEMDGEHVVFLAVGG